jgi:hypothetical protein
MTVWRESNQSRRRHGDLPSREIPPSTLRHRHFTALAVRAHGRHNLIEKTWRQKPVVETPYILSSGHQHAFCMKSISTLSSLPCARRVRPRTEGGSQWDHSPHWHAPEHGFGEGGCRSIPKNATKSPSAWRFISYPDTEKETIMRPSACRNWAATFRTRRAAALSRLLHWSKARS